MKLRTRLNLVLLGLMACVVAVLVADQIRDARSSVREEIEAANRVAAQVLGNLISTYAASGGTGAVLEMLRGLGHVRANDLILRDAGGRTLYHSPPPSYKAGREAPRWFGNLLQPEPARQIFTLGDGAQVVIEAQASRAILDAWDDLTRLLWLAAVLLLALGALTFYLVERSLAPFPVIVQGLERLQRGELTYRLPPLSGSEAHTIGAAFNRMAQAVENNVQAEREAREARSRLEERRELALLIEQSVEEERRLIAHELHDEFGQSVTAIRSLAMAIATRSTEPATSEAARLISDEAARLYDAMHGLIPRLAPLSLDTQDLAESLERLVRDWQRRHPTPRLTLEHQLADELGASATLAAYRVVQEGLTNVVRHAKATHVMIEAKANGASMMISVADDGVGLPQQWSRPGHFGLRGLKERVEHLGGTLEVRNRDPHGVLLTAHIPLLEGA
ncbi:MAG TPA: ATP-binding protein [Steroidobacteraceae bacterium]|jgi:two-component system sensor histidine kinase UhpB|nr:ATP-binding protein [Steroidobacteraceae bacterium]